MESNNHKGSELNNVRETWDQNERQRAGTNQPANGDNAEEDAAPATGLDEIIRQEALEYDNENKENRTLPGERATVNDDETPA